MDKGKKDKTSLDVRHQVPYSQKLGQPSTLVWAFPSSADVGKDRVGSLEAASSYHMEAYPVQLVDNLDMVRKYHLWRSYKIVD